ncbi:MAG: hypothetical protein II184_03000 [Clostridia bacterium]|nr:hypothetical protein [Clostridia bacterium]
MKKLYVSEFSSPGANEKTDALKALFARVCAAVPAVRFCPERDPFPSDGRIRALRFSGLSYQEKENGVFAYIGFPETAAASSPVPGMVLVHGGGGHAYAEWVRYWVDHGFAALSFDGFGQTYAGPDHTYAPTLDFWKPDPDAHIPPGGFSFEDKPFMEQGFTYYVADVILAHNLLRADRRVNREKIGATGISWGGFALSVAVCYDRRFAFAAPVYIGGFMDVSKTPWGTCFRGPGITDVWDAKLLSAEVETPVHFFNGDGDPFFDANASTAYAAALPNGALTLLPGFTHGQTEGAAVPELLRFAEEQTGGGTRNIKIVSLAAEGDGAALRFSLPSDVNRADACVYYKTEDLIYDGKYLRELWSCARTRASGGKAFVRIPPEARLFYFAVEGRTEGDPDTMLHAATGVFTGKTLRAAEQ